MKLRRSTATLVAVTTLTLSACVQDQDGAAPAEPPAGTSSTNADPGVAHDLYAHCGPNYATFDGRTWKLERPVADPPGEPFSRGSVNSLRGTMRLTADDRLRFTVDAASPVIPNAVLTYRPTTESPPPCV
ncbi:hypothetical protein [Actinophytocola sp.]|uniref:hypothetical protein n=1 Tax=Actinophytocola sp. TaxID=1872138 RepID=UPI002ED62E21